MAGERVLIIDDEPMVTRAVRIGLEGYGFVVATAVTGMDGYTQAIGRPAPQVVLLDLGLPDQDGQEVCARIRAQSTVPIIILTARGAEHEKIAALDAGADDYVTKPFGMGELLARIRVALRHAAAAGLPAPSTPIRAGDLLIDPTNHEVAARGGPVRLTPTEFKLLLLLASNPDRVMTHRLLLREVWGAGYTADVQLLRVFIGQLRTKIERDPTEPEYILTEPGVGYRFRGGDEPAEGS